MKRRPLWSRLRPTAAALFCGLLALSFSVPVWAGAVQQKSKASQSGKVKKVSQKPAKANPAAEIGPAEIAEGQIIGLHGLASFYGHGFQGRKTATGEIFNVRNFTAASNRFPLGAMVAVRRIDNDRCAIVKVNDRMHAKHRRRVIDVSRGVAEYLGMINAGVVMVRVAALSDDRMTNQPAACQNAFDPEPSCIDCGQPALSPIFLDHSLP